MATNRFVGSGAARVCAVLFGLAAVGASLSVPAGPPSRFYLALVLGVLAWISLVHSFHGLFSRWMHFAERLHNVAVTGLFGACYFVIVPFFRVIVWFRDPLQLRRRPEQTSWVRRTAVVNAQSMERMG